LAIATQKKEEKFAEQIPDRINDSTASWKNNCKSARRLSRRNSFAEVSKNLARYRSEDNFVGPSK